MSKICLSIAALLFAATIFGQQTIHVKVIDSISKKPLPFASVYEPNVNRPVIADSTGFAKVRLAHGQRTLIASYIGYEASEIQLTIPVPDTFLTIELLPSDEE